MSFRRRVVVAAAAAVAVAVLLGSVATYVAARSTLRGEVDDALRGISDRFAVAPALGVSFRSGPAPSSGGVLGAVNGLRGDSSRGRLVSQRLVREGARGTSARVDERTEAARVVGPEIERLGRFVARAPAPPLGGAPGYVQIITGDGSVERPPGADVLLPIDERARSLVARPGDSFFRDVTVQGIHARVFTTRLANGDVMQAARPLDEVDSTLSRLRWLLLAVCAGGVGLAAALGFFVSRTAARPVAELTSAAEHVAATRDLTRRIERSGDDELARLAHAFDTMLAALERSDQAQRRLVADASHELRTPLTSLRTNVEVLTGPVPVEAGDRERLRSDLIAQLEELTALVGDLVELARDGEPAGGELEDVRLDLIVAEAVQRARLHAPSLEWRLEAEPSVVDAIPSRLHRALGNLLDNAAKWSPAGATVEVKASSGEVTVRDHGPGIAGEDLPFVFERFYRAATARGRPGSGLGLAIVRQIADEHAATVTAEAAPGGGALLRLTFSANSYTDLSIASQRAGSMA